jgi:hypothetical protein
MSNIYWLGHPKQSSHNENLITLVLVTDRGIHAELYFITCITSFHYQMCFEGLGVLYCSYSKIFTLLYVLISVQTLMILY